MLNIISLQCNETINSVLCYVAAVQSIQEAVCLQRYNYQSWMALSRACVSLSTNLKSTHVRASPEAAIKCHNKVLYHEKASVDSVKKAVVVMKPHFKHRHFNREEIYSNTTMHSRDTVTATTGAATTGEEMLWIIDVLGMAVTNSDQVCIVRLADSQIFHHFLMILSCASCLWARYEKLLISKKLMGILKKVPKQVENLRFYYI